MAHFREHFIVVVDQPPRLRQVARAKLGEADAVQPGAPGREVGRPIVEEPFQVAKGRLHLLEDVGGGTDEICAAVLLLVVLLPRIQIPMLAMCPLCSK